MPGAVYIENRDRYGRLTTAWDGPNITLNGGRSAFARFLFDESQLPVRLFWFGSGSAVSSAQTSAAQYPIVSLNGAVSKPTSLSSALGASGFTGRFWAVIGPNEFTGRIRELLTTTYSLDASPRHARALIDGGTGFDHNSGEQAMFRWDFVIGTGQQPF